MARWPALGDSRPPHSGLQAGPESLGTFGVKLDVLASVPVLACGLAAV